jgi:hypothetical protein
VGDLIYNYEFEAMVRRGYDLAMLDLFHAQKASAALWRGVVHCRKVVLHREERDAARAAATRSFLDGMDLSFLKPPPDFLAGRDFSKDLLGPDLKE